jgi:DNA processing protein
MTESKQVLSHHSDQLFWIWLSLRLGAGNRLYPQLLERFGSAYDVFEAREERLRELLPDLTEKQLAALADKRLEDAFAVEEYCRKHGIRILCYHEDAYPYSYRVLNDPPLLLYCRGELPSFQNQLCVAIVGTRRMSEYGRSMAYKIAYELASAGAIVVSGMALGIDSVASCAAMKAGGKTIAILGGGVDVPYPPEHEGFMNIIANRGVLISEFAPGAEPKGTNFPIRNRLISGLCQATVVIDAEEGSGSLITADRALQQGRDLFAVPANVGAANASGTNRLIRDGAHVALSGRDILSYYEFLYTDLRHLPKNLPSDYDAAALAEMGVYSRVVGGYVRVPAEQAGALPVAQQKTEASKPAVHAPQKTEDAKPKNAKRTENYEVKTVSAEKEQPTDSRMKPKDASDPGDRSSAAVASLNETQRAILDAIPSEEPIAVDKLKHLGMPMGTLLAAISVLQIKGLVRSLPGGMISRK